MATKDYRHHETKKPKKGNKKISQVPILSPPVEVEVIKKGKKKREGEEEET